MSIQQLVPVGGTYALEETGVKNQFYFFRNDGERLSNVSENSILALVAPYLLNQEGEGRNFKYRYEISSDGKRLRVTVSQNEEEAQNRPSAVRPRPNFLKKLDLLFKEYFG